MVDVPRRVAHLDMDAFYASVELLRRPELRGQPVVVGGRRAGPATEPGVDARLKDYKGRGVVTTATYEARALGVHSGQGLMQAARLAPMAILLPADFDAYRHYSRLFKAAVRDIAPAIEDRGIDEIYIDLTGYPDASGVIARKIKEAVRDATGLSCSIGVAANKLLAKIASDLDKPDGLTLVEAGDLERRLWPLPAKRINGIGPKASERLASLNIHTIGDLARQPESVLQVHFGQRIGAWMARAAQGIDDRPVVTSSVPKSFSRETTFERDLDARRDRPTLSALFTQLCERLSEDLTRRGYAGRTVGIKLRFEDFSTVTRDITLPQPVCTAPDIRRAAGECLRRVSLDRRLRLLGVRVGTLVDPDAQTNDGPQAELPLAS